MNENGLWHILMTMPTAVLRSVRKVRRMLFSPGVMSDIERALILMAMGIWLMNEDRAWIVSPDVTEYMVRIIPIHAWGVISMSIGIWIIFWSYRESHSLIAFGYIMATAFWATFGCILWFAPLYSRALGFMAPVMVMGCVLRCLQIPSFEEFLSSGIECASRTNPR